LPGIPAWINKANAIVPLHLEALKLAAKFAVNSKAPVRTKMRMRSPPIFSG
jgi:hypothetical protein